MHVSSREDTVQRAHNTQHTARRLRPAPCSAALCAVMRHQYKEYTGACLREQALSYITLCHQQQNSVVGTQSRATRCVPFSLLLKSSPACFFCVCVFPACLSLAPAENNIYSRAGLPAVQDHPERSIFEHLVLLKFIHIFTRNENRHACSKVQTSEL